MDNNQFIFLVFITLKCYCVMSFRKLYPEHVCVCMCVCACACRCSFQGGQGRKCFTVGTLLRQEGTATLISKRTLQTLGVQGTFTSEFFFQMNGLSADNYFYRFYI